MFYKKILIIPIVIICLILSLTFFVLNLNISGRLTSILESTETETNIASALEKLVGGKDKVIVEIPEKDVCYWIRSTRDVKYFFEIKKYQSKTGKCFGLAVDESSVTLENGMNVLGDTDCLCSGEKYLLEKVVEGQRVDLKITKW
jgi:hypothetical protein